MPLSTGKQDMDSICSDLKEEVQWEDPTLPSIVMRREQFSQGQLIKENYLSAIGQLVRLMKREAKTIQLLAFGVNKDALDLSLPWIYSHPMKA